jgi:hypothetical protein
MGMPGQVFATITAVAKIVFAHVAETVAWLLNHLHWQVAAWVTAALLGLGGLMVRNEEYSGAIALFSMGITLLFTKFVSWAEVRQAAPSQRVTLILLAVLFFGGIGISAFYWIDGLRPVPPDIVALQKLGDANARELHLFNRKTTINGVRIKIKEHVHRYDPESLLRFMDAPYKDLGLVQSFAVIPLKTIELEDKDAYQVDAITTFGKFNYMLYYEKQADGTWHERYVASHLGGDIIKEVERNKSH